MKSSWGVVIALCCAVGAVALGVRLRSSDETGGVSSSATTGPRLADRRVGEDRGVGDPRSAAGAPGESRAGAGDPTGSKLRGPSVGESTRPGELTQGNRGDRVRRPPSTGAAGGIAGARSGVGGKLTLPEGAEQASGAALDHHDVPPAERPDTQTAAEATDDPVPEEIPEVAYDGADQVFDTGSQVEITDAGTISGDAGTISFWIKPEWKRGSREDANFVQLGDSGLQILKEGNSMRFQYTDSTGNMYGGGADVSDWQAGNWRHVTATWTGSTLSLYVDGGQVFLNGSPTPPDLHSDTTLYVGSAFPSGIPAAAGQLSHLTVLNRQATAAEVAQMYQSGGGPPNR